MVLDIVTFPAKRLRNKSENIKKITPEILKLIDDMKDTLMDIGGYGLAAPQVGQSLKLFIADENACRNGKNAMQVFINPEILDKNGEILEEEGCLSVPEEYAVVKRFLNIKVKALNEKGEEFILDASEKLARIIQHENDHLDGVLFIDHLPLFKKDTLKKHIKRRIKEGDYIITDY